MEIDYKKEYEAMVQRARELHETGNELTKRQMEIVCHELRESEDERIRKAVIHYILYETKGTISEATEHTWVKWLEKQKESLHIPGTCKDNADSFTDDDRIRKEIIEYLKLHDKGENDYAHTMFSEWFAWLEKQKEQKVDIDKLRRDIYQSGYNDGYRHGKEDAQKEQKLTEWSEFNRGVLEDAICATDLLGNDKSFNKDNPNLAKAFRIAKDWLKSLPERFNPRPKPEWSEEDREMLNSILLYFNAPFHDMTDGELKAFNWLKSLPEKFTLQPTQEWREEDEKMLADISWAIRYCAYNDKKKKQVHDWVENRFKSLRPQPKAELTLLDENIIEAAVAFVEQNDHFNVWRGIDKHTVLKALRSLKPHWKPSEEQMRALQVVVDEHWDVDGDALYSLYTDLKELM